MSHMKLQHSPSCYKQTFVFPTFKSLHHTQRPRALSVRCLTPCSASPLFKLGPLCRVKVTQRQSSESCHCGSCSLLVSWLWSLRSANIGTVERRGERVQHCWSLASLVHFTVCQQWAVATGRWAQVHVHPLLFQPLFITWLLGPSALQVWEFLGLQCGTLRCYSMCVRRKHWDSLAHSAVGAASRRAGVTGSSILDGGYC